MSINRKHRSGLFFITVLFTVTTMILFQTACEEEEECTIPRIDSLTFRDSTNSITYLVPTKVVTLHGENLDNITSVYINQTAMNTLYMLVYEHSITLLVPSVETNDVDEEMSDSIRVIKDCGESLFMINILNAPPYIEKISNEYAIPGDTLTLEGTYFSLLESVVFPGDIEGEILSDYNDTVCRVIVPNGVLNEGEILLTSKSGTGTSAFGIEYRDKTGLVCNFDDLNTWEGYGGSVIAGYDDPDIPSANGYFFLGEAAAVEPGTNEIESTILPFTVEQSFGYPGNLTPDYFALKMEVFTKHPWTAGAYRIEIGKRNASEEVEYAYEYNYEPWNQEDTTVTFTTPRWETVTLPLSGFNLAGSETIYLQSYAQLRAINYMQFGFINPPQEDGGETIDQVSIAFDNIRIKQILEPEE